MDLNRKTIIGGYRTGIIWRVLLLVMVLTLFVVLITTTNYIVSPVVTGCLAAILVFKLIRFSERTNEELIRFLDSIRYNDYSQSFSQERYGKSFAQLRLAFTRIADQFRKERTERQESVRYLETVIQHIGIGLITFNSSGTVSLLNNSARQMLGVAALHSLSQLKEVDDTLYKAIADIKGGNRTLVQMEKNGETMQWSIYATEFIKRGDSQKLVSMQNISSELDEKEMEAWQNLTQVLAHEIMNSITPIASLSETVNTLVSNNMTPDNRRYSVDEETLRDVQEALDTIHNRSNGLMRFVQSYRDFTRIPDPELKKVRVTDLLNRLIHLLKGEFEKSGITVSVNVVPENLAIKADPELIEQVLINLTKNAFRALKETSSPEIRFEAGVTEHGKAEIRVRDNGPGIPEPMLEKIFIPFFTSVSSDGSRGSGIGLSLSRQIMRSHRGTLTVHSTLGKETVFTLRF